MWTAVRDAWRGTSQGLRVLSLVLWTLGAVLLIAGWRLDASNWWSFRPFITNVASSLTTALIGTPIALIVLQRLVALEEEHRERVEVERAARGALWEMSRRVTNLVAGVPKASIQSLQQQLQALKESIEQGKRSSSALYVTQLEILRVWEQIRFSTDRHAAAVAEVRSSWSYLRNQIAPELRRFGIPIPDDIQDQFGEALDALHPSQIADVERLEGILDPRNLGRTFKQRITGVDTAQMYLSAYLALDDSVNRMLSMYRKDGVQRDDH